VTKVIVHNNNTKDLSLWNMQFRTKAEKFIGCTNKYYYNTNKGLKLHPGGIYTGIWCRDAFYVLRDWFISGRVYEALEQLYIIWSYQIRYFPKSFNCRPGAFRPHKVSSR
jgi:hypothetical protein